MGKSKSKSAAGNRKSGLAQAPWLFINDATSDAALYDQVVANLVSLIPIARISRLDSEEPNHLHPNGCWERPTTENCIVIFGRRQLDASAAVEAANEGREKAIELGKNFASVNLTKDGSLTGNGGTVNWGTNHLELNTTQLAAPQAADKIFRWLCKLSRLWHFYCLVHSAPVPFFHVLLTTFSCSQGPCCPRNATSDP